MHTPPKNTGNKPNSQNMTTGSQSQTPTQLLAHKKSESTRISVHCDAGFPNKLYLRGTGANLTWSRGIPLKNVKSDLWVWETNQHFDQAEFKVLFNDILYEDGQNHTIKPGTSLDITPHFQK